MNMIETESALSEQQAESLQTGSLLAQQKPLSHNVLEAISSYFDKVGNTFVNNVYEMVLAEVEKPLLEAVMSYTKGNQSKAAIVLGISRGTLRKKLKIYGMLD
ncbi:MAG: DNA-binding transcriptional regulator Fis [Gammaproteobacteria bacterium]